MRHNSNQGAAFRSAAAPDVNASITPDGACFALRWSIFDLRPWHSPFASRLSFAQHLLQRKLSPRSSGGWRSWGGFDDALWGCGWTSSSIILFALSQAPSGALCADHLPAAVTRQTVFPTSSAIRSPPDLSIASPTGRPRAWFSLLRKPVTTSCAMPSGFPSLKGTNTTL